MSLGVDSLVDRTPYNYFFDVASFVQPSAEHSFFVKGSLCLQPSAEHSHVHRTRLQHWHTASNLLCVPPNSGDYAQYFAAVMGETISANDIVAAAV